MKKRILLNNGFVVDGTGSKGFHGSVILNNESIDSVIEGNTEISTEGFDQVIDCTGYVIAPGFIDMHSHMDWVLPTEGREEFKLPFIKQGITTVVAGNCGYSAAGLKKESKFMEEVQDNIFKGSHDGIKWASMEEYFQYLQSVGMSHNLVMLGGHGTTRLSVCGSKTTINRSEKDEINKLLELAMDQGAAGVSFGLQYEPGQYSTVDEIEEIAKIVKKKDKILTAHGRAYSRLSGDYPLIPFGTEHNIKAIQELIDIARSTGVKLQLSHLIFVGNATQKTCEKAISIIDKAISEGIDVSFDTYGHHCGVSVINVFLPPWFKSRGMEACSNPRLLLQLKMLMKGIFYLLGFNFSSIQILDAKCPELSVYNGMFLSEISKKRGLSDFDNYIDFIKKSNSTATVLMHNYTSEDNLKELIKHKASMFMTDAWFEVSGWQNPAVFGSIPRLIQLTRNNGLLKVEELVKKLTSAPAARVGIKNRGTIKEGYYADITVFDWNKTEFNITGACLQGEPKGIKHVFINGSEVYSEGEHNKYSTCGKMLRV